MHPPTLSTQQLFSHQSTDRDNVLDVIHAAFAPGAPGILLVNHLYQTFEHDRIKLFQGARALAKLPPHQLAQLELPHLQYAVGWSRGRENFRGVLDHSKGSFYANPIYDHPSQGDAVFDAKYKHCMHRNLWPPQRSCRNVEPYFKAIGRYINTIAIQIAHHCDRYLRSKLSNHQHLCSLEKLLRHSTTAKGRLLHYFATDAPPSASPPPDEQPLWCAFHNDHGLITGLLGGAYYEHDSELPMAHARHPTAGLYVVRACSTDEHKVTIPAGHIAFQIGETAQILSGGLLRATPHAVKMGCDMRHISRVSFAVFLQPSPQVELALPRLGEQQREQALLTDARIPPLAARYQEGNTFGEFAARTIECYVDYGGARAEGRT